MRLSSVGSRWISRFRLGGMPRLAQVREHDPRDGVQQHPERREAALRLLRALQPQRAVGRAVGGARQLAVQELREHLRCVGGASQACHNWGRDACGSMRVSRSIAGRRQADASRVWQRTGQRVML